MKLFKFANMAKCFSLFIIVNLIHIGEGKAYWIWSQFEWGNNGIPNYHSKIIKGDFNGDGQDELLSVTDSASYDEYAILFLDQSFPRDWDSRIYESNTMGGWIIQGNDQYIAGDFDGDGLDELLAVNPSGEYHTMRYDTNHSGALDNPWIIIATGTNGLIRTDDQYMTGDFDGDGKDELLAIYTNGWYRVMGFDGSNWNVIADNNGNGFIHWWTMHTNDKYVVGDFNNDGKDELLAVHLVSGGWYHTMGFDAATSSWNYITGGSNGSIDQWIISGVDELMAGDYNCDGADELLAINPFNGWSHTMSLQTSGWPTWTYIIDLDNGGSGEIGNWQLNPSDIRVSGNFYPSSQCGMVLNISPQKWNLIGVDIIIGL